MRSLYVEKKCLAVEDWLIPFKKTCEDLEALGAPFTNTQQPNHPVPFATYQSIYTLLEQLPADATQSIESFAKELDDLHLKLFGDLRRFGQGVQLTNDWIDHHFNYELKRGLHELYYFANIFKDDFAKLQHDPQNIDLQKKFMELPI